MEMLSCENADPMHSHGEINFLQHFINILYNFIHPSQIVSFLQKCIWQIHFSVYNKAYQERGRSHKVSGAPFSITQTEKLEDLKAILDASNANGVMISNIMGYGNQKGHKKIYRGAEYSVNLLPKVKVETVVDPETAEPLIQKIVEEIRTGAYGDGKIFVYEVEDAVRIRTGERGTAAL